jgi:hypothetical protein
VTSEADAFHIVRIQSNHSIIDISFSQFLLMVNDQIILLQDRLSTAAAVNISISISALFNDHLPEVFPLL